MGLISEKQSRDAHDLESERECIAAEDVLARIYHALSSKAMSSCITRGFYQSKVLHKNDFSRLFMKDGDCPLITKIFKVMKYNTPLRKAMKKSM